MSGTGMYPPYVSHLKLVIFEFFTNLTKSTIEVMPEGQTDNISGSIDHRDNFILFQALIGGIMCCMLPSFSNYGTIWDTRGLIAALVLHILISEPLYYWMHRLLHSNFHLFNAYHSAHHSSPVPQPFTGRFRLGAFCL